MPAKCGTLFIHSRRSSPAPPKTHLLAELFTDHCLQLKKAFEFLKLPPEVRNMIYWNVLVKRHPFHPFAPPPLTQVNKQIRSESLSVLYGNGLFVANCGSHSMAIPLFLQCPELATAIPNPAYITKLEIRFDFGSARSFRQKGLSVLINMRADKSECGSLGNDDFVGRPDLEWRDKARIENHYRRLLHETVLVCATRHMDAIFAAKREMRPLVSDLLCFAKRCPAAAKWVWMVVELADLVA